MCCFPDWHFQMSKSDCWFVQLIFFFLTEGEDVCTLLIECISLVKRQRKLKKWCDDRILSHDAPRFMLYYHCVRDTSLSVIFSTREEKIDRSARCGWFPNMFRFSSFCFWDSKYIHCALKENFSVALTEKGFTCISLICRELLVPRLVAL